MGWSHPIAGTVKYQAGQQVRRAPEPKPLFDIIGGQPSLDRLEKLPVQDGLVVCQMDLAAVEEFTDVAPVLEKVVQPPFAEAPSSNHPPISPLSDFRLDARPVQVLQKRPDSAQL